MARRKSAKNEIQDPSLPLKKRARWRLIGACVLAMGALIILPIALESEPRRELGDVQIRMPPRTEIGKMDRVLPASAQPPRAAASAPAGAAGPAAGAGAAIGATAAAAAVAAGNAAGTASKTVTRPVAAPAPRIQAASRSAAPRPVASTQTAAAAKSTPSKPVKRANAPKPPRAAAGKPVRKPQRATTAPKREARRSAPAPVAKPAKPAKPTRATKPPRKAPVNKAPVKVAKAAAAPPIPERRTNRNSIKSASPSGYVVQIGAFSSRRGAKAQVARGAKLGFSPYTEVVKTRKGDRIRVRVGPYLTRKQADQARAVLRKAGIDTALIAP